MITVEVVFVTSAVLAMLAAALLSRRRRSAARPGLLPAADAAARRRSLDAEARSEFEREAALLALRGDAGRVIAEPWVVLAFDVVDRLLARDGDQEPDTKGGRSVRLPGGVRVLFRPHKVPDVRSATLIEAWRGMRPWRIRRGLQILRLTADWLQRAEQASDADPPRVQKEAPWQFADVLWVGIFDGRPKRKGDKPDSGKV